MGRAGRGSQTRHMAVLAVTPSLWGALEQSLSLSGLVISSVTCLLLPGSFLSPASSLYFSRALGGQVRGMTSTTNDFLSAKCQPLHRALGVSYVTASSLSGFSCYLCLRVAQSCERICSSNQARGRAGKLGYFVDKRCRCCFLNAAVRNWPHQLCWTLTFLSTAWAGACLHSALRRRKPAPAAFRVHPEAWLPSLSLCRRRGAFIQVEFSRGLL